MKTNHIPSTSSSRWCLHATSASATPRAGTCATTAQCTTRGVAEALREPPVGDCARGDADDGHDVAHHRLAEDLLADLFADFLFVDVHQLVHELLARILFARLQLAAHAA